MTDNKGYMEQHPYEPINDQWMKVWDRVERFKWYALGILFAVLLALLIQVVRLLQNVRLDRAQSITVAFFIVYVTLAAKFAPPWNNRLEFAAALVISASIPTAFIYWIMKVTV